MIKAYLNYPNPHMMLHSDSACGEIGKMQKASQREVAINRASFTQALNQLADRGFQLGAQASINDVWLIIDFSDAEFEEAVARFVCRVLGQRYSPLRNAPIRKHC
jgi:glutamate synthase domain-containing protein 1